MGDYEQSTTVFADTAAVYDYLSDVANLPTYFARMTSAEPGDSEEVRTTAQVDGQRVEGTAWFRTDDAAKHLAWGSEGPSDYRGDLDVADDPAGCVVTVSLHTERVADGSSEVESGLRETLANIKRLCEG